MKLRTLVTFLIIASSLWAKAQAEVPHVAPAALVQCKTDATCDRDPKHLEQFVADFYKWYVANRWQMLTLNSPLYPTTNSGREKQMWDFYRVEHPVLAAQLTPDFYAWYERKMNDYDGENSAPFCSNPDADPILCMFNPPDKWLSDVHAHIAAMDWDSAHILVDLPEAQTLIYPEKIIKQLPSTRIITRLKVIKGEWRIDLVTSAPDNGR